MAPGENMYHILLHKYFNFWEEIESWISTVVHGLGMAWVTVQLLPRCTDYWHQPLRTIAARGQYGGLYALFMSPLITRPSCQWSPWLMFGPNTGVIAETRSRPRSGWNLVHPSDSSNNYPTTTLFVFWFFSERFRCLSFFCGEKRLKIKCVSVNA